MHYIVSVRRWREEFHQTPLYMAVSKLFGSSIDQSLTVEERSEAFAPSTEAPCAAGMSASISADFDEHAYSLACVRSGLTEARRKAFMREAENATSTARLAVVIGDGGKHPSGATGPAF